MSLADKIAQAAQQQTELLNQIAEYRKAEAAYSLLAAEQIHKNILLIKRNIEQQARPTLMLRPMVIRDGEEWVASYYECQGRGPTPELACQSFDAAWLKGNPDAGIEPDA
jgi:hypothetical protein